MAGGCGVAGGDDGPSTARSFHSEALTVMANATTTIPPTTTTTIDPNQPRPTNVAIAPLQSGQRPPQFVLFSFDGVGNHERWEEFMAAAERVGARFTGFLTGTYLLTDAARGAYTGPGHRPGKSSVGFGGSPERVQTLVDDLNRAWRAGHEIGTHYNGHFCDGADPSGNNWDTGAWNSEIGQFFDFWRNWAAHGAVPNPRPLVVPPEAVKGGRTPCLEGRWDQLQGAWQAAGLRYDSSVPGPGMAWPRIENGVWEFRMPSVQSPPLGRVLAMDYNFWVAFNGAEEQPDRAPELRQAVLDTYRHMYDVAFNSARPPLLVANHFNRWNGDAFNPAAMDFMAEVCTRPETVCATHSDVIAWIEAQDPAVTQWLQAQPPVG